VAAHEPAEAAAERQAADAGVRDLAGGHREAVLLRGRVELAEQGTPADAHDRALGVDLDPVQRPQVDAQRAVADRAPGDRVAAGADRERPCRGACGTDRRRDVLGVAGVRDGGGPAVDRAVPAGTGVVVVRIVRPDETSGEAVVAQDGGERWDGRGCGAHAGHGRADRRPGRRGAHPSRTPIRNAR
jgi:hypothetical protein